MSRKWITIRAVCEEHGLGERTVRRYIAEGKLTAYRVGGRLIRLDAEEVERQLITPLGGGA
jgi:excisionase family DNA binding protein